MPNKVLFHCKGLVGPDSECYATWIKKKIILVYLNLEWKIQLVLDSGNNFPPTPPLTYHFAPLTALQL